MLRRTGRLLTIYYVLLKHGLDKFLWSSNKFRPVRFAKILFPWRWFGKPNPPTGEDLRLALEELGPIFVKFGQLLSTRRDFLSDDMAQELAKLQDNVPPFDSTIAKAMLEDRFKQPLESVFANFDLTPLASASISQVHAATLMDGSDVVVKVLRPQITKQVQRDVELMETVAKWLEHLVPSLRRFHPIQVVQEIKNTLFDELDLLREAANASQLKRNFINSTHLYVPKIYWDYCHRDIMVIERIYSISLSDVETLKANNTDLKKLAERGVEIFFTQVFRDSFFHADMHPGNIGARIDDPLNPQYVAVDFGIMGTLSPEDQRYLGENFLAFFKRDYRRVAELHVQSGWVPPGTRVEAFESAIRTVCEPIFERPLKDISIGQTLLRLFQTARRFDMQVQPQLILLQKTLLAIEGLGRQLYPDLDLWQTAKPFLEKWMKQQFGVRAILGRIKTQIPMLASQFPSTPQALDQIAKFLQHETHQMGNRPQLLKSMMNPKQKSRQLSMKILGATLVLGGLVVALSAPSHPMNVWMGDFRWMGPALLSLIGLTLVVR